MHTYYNCFFFFNQCLGGKTGSGVVEAKLLKCDDESVQNEQAWVIHDDPRALSVCDKHVPGKLLFSVLLSWFKT